MSETLEELISIRDGAVDDDVFYDGRYLSKKLYIRTSMHKHHSDKVEKISVYTPPLYVNTDKLRSLSDINLIIELMEQVESLKEELQDGLWRSGEDYE